MRKILPLVFSLAIPALADHIPIDVALHMSGLPFVERGTETTYTITLTAVFPGAAYAVTDTLPANARFVRAGGPFWNCLESKGKVTCGNERLSGGTSSFDVTVIAPDSPQAITNSAHVDSVSVYDPNPGNNDDSVTTVVYDPAICAANAIQALAPPPHGIATAPHVTFQWSAVPGATGYKLYAAEGSTVLTLVGSTTDTQIVRDFVPGEVQWYVEATLPDCPPVFTIAQLVIVEAPRMRGRVAHH